MMQWRLLFHHFWLFHLPSLSRTQRDRPEISKCVVELGALGVVKVLHIFELSQKLGDQHIFVLLLYFFRKILKEEFSWLWMNAKFSELMDNFICWIYSPSFVFRKQNFCCIFSHQCFRWYGVSQGVTLWVTLDIHIQMFLLCESEIPWWCVSVEDRNGVPQRICIYDLVQVVWPTSKSLSLHLELWIQEIHRDKKGNVLADNHFYLFPSILLRNLSNINPLLKY